MKKALTILVALALGMTAFAQYGPNRPGGMGNGFGNRPGGRPGRGYYGFGGELEVGFSVNNFTKWSKDGVTVDRPDRIGVFGEYRMDLGGYMDMGIQLSTTFGKGTILHDVFADDARYWQGAALLVTDFNLLPYSGFNPYVGIGIGPGFGYEKNKVTDYSDWTHALVLGPRVGVELFECLRMSVQYQWYLNDSNTFSHFAFGLSWAFDPSTSGRRMRR